MYYIPACKCAFQSGAFQPQCGVQGGKHYTGALERNKYNLLPQNQRSSKPAAA